MVSGPDPFDFGDHGRDPFRAAAGGHPAPPPAVAAQTGGDSDHFGLDGPGAPATHDVIGRPPLVWLVIGLGLGALAAVAASVLGGSATIAFASWVAAGPLAIGLLAVFATRDTQQRARPVYDAPGWTASLYWLVIAVAAVGIGLSAWRIAEWAGRL